MSLLWFCGKKPGAIDFEAESREKLITLIADHYAEGYSGPEEDSPPPEYADVGFSLNGGAEEWLTGPERASFNADLQEAFEAAIDGWDQSSEYEEHNTHWGLR